MCDRFHQLTSKKNHFFSQESGFILCGDLHASLIGGTAFRKFFPLSVIFLFFCASFGFGQQKINGVVSGISHFLLAGVTITIKGSNEGTITDTSGHFVILAKRGEILVFSFVGYNSMEVRVGNETSLALSLILSDLELEQQIVLGYTTQKVKEIAGSVAIVKPADLTAIPSGQVEQMLQGRVAGLNVISSGEPGSASNVRLHGIGNFGDVTPLYIIDGVQGDINSINPYDIESLQVLKDAGAYSIYGVRGANGVIMVTTKKGKTGKTSFSYDSYFGLQEPLKRGLDLLSPQGTANLEWLAAKNSGISNFSDPLYGNGANPVLPDFIVNNAILVAGYPAGDSAVQPGLNNVDYMKGSFYQIMQFNKKGTDWFHQLFRPAFSQNHTLSASGGNDKNKYFFSIGYLDQEGTFVNTFLKKFTARINTDFSAKNNIHFGENVQLAYMENPKSVKGNPAGLVFSGDIEQVLLSNPYQPVYDIKGNWSTINPFNPSVEDNPLALRTLTKNDKYQTWQAFGNAYAQADFLKYFTIRTSIGGSFNFFYSYNYTYGSYNSLVGGQANQFNENSGYTSSWTWTNTLSYSRIFRARHKVKVIAGTEDINNYSRDQGGSRQGYLINDPNYRFLSNGDPNSQMNFSAAFASFLASFFFRADYGFMEKYFLSATLRRDGSSVFGPENRYGWFPALSAAWRITEEKFMRESKWLTDLKLRASWGKTGFNGNTNPLNQYTLYNSNTSGTYYDIFGTSNSAVGGFRLVNFGNPNTGWQQDIVTNLGFESIFFQRKLNITADWYIKKSKGLLFPASLPALLGSATPPNTNIGDVQNKGVDILLGSKGKFSRNWSWDLSITFTTYQNKIIKLNGSPYIDYNNTLFNTAGVRNAVGHPIGSYFGFQVIGYFHDSADVKKSPYQESAAPGRFKYLDANHDNKIDADDMTFIGNPNPKFTSGINIRLNFKQFDLSTFFYGSFGNDVLNEFKWVTDFYSPGGIGSKTALYDSWTPQATHPKAPIAELDAGNFSTSQVPNSYPIEKGGYLRNKSIMLGYSLQSSLLQSFKMDRLRMYIQIVNLFTITRYSGLDPELSGSSQAWGFDEGNYPNNQKQFLVGLSLTF